MARNFNGSSDLGEYAGAVVTAMPLTLACRFRPSGSGGNRTLLSIDDGSATDTWYRLFVNNGDQLVANNGSSLGTQSSATSSGTVSAGTWFHGAAVFGSSTSRDVYLNGTGVNDSASVSPGTPSRTHIGTLELNATGKIHYHTGDIAEAAVWDVALTAAEIAALAGGFSPLLVRPTSLVAYWPLGGRNSPELDRMGAGALTLTGTAYAEHSRVICPRRGQARRFTTAAGGAAGPVATNVLFVRQAIQRAAVR